MYWDTAKAFQAARESGLTKEFDVLCARKALVNAAGIPANQKLFINLNRETFIDRACIDDILKECPMKLSKIVFELTEQSFLSEVEKLAQSVNMLMKKGIQLAIDDMGGGSVSLRETAMLMPSYIKFDHSLIRNIHKDEAKQRILISLLVFAKGIRSRTVAEGIETRDEMKYLQKSDVDFGQGYFIAKPWKMGFASRQLEKT